MVFRLILLGTLTAVSYIFSLLDFLGVGIILDDNYVFASGEEREKMNKPAYYLQSAIIFLFIGTIFLLCMLRLLSGILFFSRIARFICIAALIYVIVSHYVIKNKQ